MACFRGYVRLDIPFGDGLTTHSFFIKEHIEKNNKGQDNSKSEASHPLENALFVGNIDVIPYLMDNATIGELLMAGKFFYM